jgi:tetratricopeptide (TPR) repeat protein
MRRKISGALREEAMAVLERFEERKILVIDDLGGMRTQMQMTLTNCGFRKLHLVSSIQQALAKFAEEKYDIILCDYYLGEGTDGQQFLEYLRTRDLISRNTLFIMVTAEQSYEKVVTASECAPDDYLLKPFTAERFIVRMEKLLDRQDRFKPVDKASDEKNWNKVIAECDRIIAAKDKYLIDAYKIKAATLLKTGRAQDALALYQGVLALRPIVWAKLGFARASEALGKKDEALKMVQELIEESPQFMAAYDYLGKLLTDKGQHHDALEALERARAISPGTMKRVREVSALAATVGKHELAEAVMSEALQKHKYSPVREANDYATLSHALNKLGKSDKALEVIKDAKVSMRDDSSKAILAASECLTHQTMGNPDKAQAALEEALAVGQKGLSPDAATALANACFAAGKTDAAHDLLKHVVQNNPDNPHILDKVHKALAASGKNPDEAAAIIKANVQEVIHLNNEGVKKAEAGQLKEAIDLLSNAADRLPNNLQIVGNAALAYAIDLAKNGYDAEKAKRCLHYRQLLISQAPSFPKLEQIDAMLKQLKR